ncbi:MAG TPA: TrkA C-terminal domain-containing protein [Longimicrobiales bacterium]|nr:TrkA C-terminal domain-containing protein [Longimicrobiales bacterium]
MIDALAGNPLILLFLVAAIGYPLGRVRVRGTRLGVAMVLFAGLAVGALDPRLRLPEIVYLLGLVLFIYPIALASGPAFFAAFRRKGLRDNALIAAGLLFAAAVTALAARLLQLDSALATGLFAGSLTSTPALAAAIEALRAAGVIEAVRAQPVVGYSIAYPVGVIGPIVALLIARRIWRVDFAKEAESLRGIGNVHQELEPRTIEVLRAEGTGRPLAQIAAEQGWSVVFTRVEQPDGVEVFGSGSTAGFGAHVTLVGAPAELDRVEAFLGRRGERPLNLDRSEIDYRRIFVSSRAVAGRTVRELALPARFGAVITRVIRGDVELLPHASLVLELGDRVRVVARRERLDQVSAFFGDSYRALAEIDITTFALGLFLGLLAGLVPIPLPGGITVHLGFAGGPLLVGLLLGARGFTGRFVWTMPYTANLTVRQLGLVLFLAGVGTQAGYPFMRTLLEPAGALLFAGGALITCSTALLVLWAGYRVLHVPMTLLSGMLAGLQTQPAVLGFATEQAGSDLPNVGYATVYPTATILKIVLVQLLLALL